MTKSADPGSAHAEILRANLNATLEGVETPAPWYRGKVRDVFARASAPGPADELLLVATDRVSAFDVILGTIPFKGALLTEQATFWLEKANDVIDTHLIERVDAQAMRCRRAEAIPVELVVRGYLAGSLLREPAERRGSAYGLRIDPRIGNYAQLPAPIVTPTTKEAVGKHDEPCSLADLVRTGRVEQGHLDRCVEAALALYKLGAAFAAGNGLLLVDTKYEFGLIDGRVVLIDEVHTADSSRFWLADTFAARLAASEPPDMLDKERLRRWVIGRGFQGHGQPPTLTDEVRIDLAAHYWDLTERVLGRTFTPPATEPVARVGQIVRAFVEA